jgi:hypothetical protein
VLDDATLRDGLAEFGFGGDTSSTAKLQALEIQDGETALTMDSILPQRMSIEHLAEFQKLTLLLRGQETGDLPAIDFKALEQHFARCFSLPSIMAVLVMNTDRFQTGRADPYANQQACELFGVKLTQVLHIIMGITATRRVSEVLSQAARAHASTAHVSGIWINTIDSHGNPCPRLVDIWLPRVVFNGTSFVVIIAPHRTVTLDRPFETFRVPLRSPSSFSEL